MLAGFKDFILRGNVVDLAVAVVMGTAFGAIVTAVVTNVIGPVVAALGGGGELGWGVQLGEPGNASTFLDAGAVVTAAIAFLTTAAVVYFLLVVPMTRLRLLRGRGELEEVKATPEDIALLQEIRDLLKTRGPA